MFRHVHRQKKRYWSLGRHFLIAFLVLVPSLTPRSVDAAGDGSIKSTVKIDSSTANGPTLADNDLYGRPAAIGDLDGDGVPDMAVGSYQDDTGGFDRGAVYVHFMNANGNIKSTVKIAHGLNGGPTLVNGDFYGVSVAGLGDLDGDGVPDMAVGAHGDDTGGFARGAVYVHFMNADGSVKSTAKIAHGTTNGPTLVDSDTYGVSVAGLGDLDGDGVRDLAVGANGDDTGGSGRGAVYVHFMNADGSVKSTVKLSSLTANGPTLVNNDNYGVSVAGLDDLDGDGIIDLAAGSEFDNTGGSGRGAVYVHFMNANGTVKSTVKIASGTVNGPTLANSDFYGRTIATPGDLDGDGIIDLVVGAGGDDTGGNARGAVYLHFMNADGSIKSTVKIASGTANGPTLSDGDGYSRVAAIGDLDGDGVPDLAVGAAGDDTGGNNRGAIYVHFMAAVVTSGRCSSGEIILDGPNPGEVLHAGMTKDIFWTANGCELEAVDLRLSFDSGASFIEIVALDLDIDARKGHYAWTVPDMPSTRGRLKAILSVQGGAVVATDESPGDFIILGTEPGIPAPEPEPQPEPEPVPEPAAGPTIDSELELQEGPATSCVTGDLLKGSTPDVYYCGLDGKRHVFPNEDVYFSWFESFDGLKFVSDEVLAGISLGENVTLKPGNLIRIEAEPPIYEVGTRRLLSLFLGEPPEDIISLSAAFVLDYRFD